MSHVVAAVDTNDGTRRVREIDAAEAVPGSNEWSLRVMTTPDPSGTVPELTRDTSGQYGVAVISGAVAAPGPYTCLHVITAATISAWTETGGTGGASMLVTLPPGYYFGKGISFTQTSGLVRAFT